MRWEDISPTLATVSLSDRFNEISRLEYIRLFSEKKLYNTLGESVFVRSFYCDLTLEGFIRDRIE